MNLFVDTVCCIVFHSYAQPCAYSSEQFLAVVWIDSWVFFVYFSFLLSPLSSELTAQKNSSSK